jgi:hypothetical protein
MKVGYEKDLDLLCTWEVTANWQREITKPRHFTRVWWSELTRIPRSEISPVRLGHFRGIILRASL